MTPQEKAKQLVDKFIVFVEAYTSDGQLNNAKICALIAVDEVLELNHHHSDYDWWMEVKHEIKKL